jgi:hypothetical protein
LSEHLSGHASVFPNAVTQAHNKLIVCQSFNNREFFHETPPINKNIYNTDFFELRRCVVCRANTQVGVRDQKIRKRGKYAKLERAMTTAAESCIGARDGVKNLSSAFKRNRRKSNIKTNEATAREPAR